MMCSEVKITSDAPFVYEPPWLHPIMVYTMSYLQTIGILRIHVLCSITTKLLCINTVYKYINQCTIEFRSCAEGTHRQLDFISCQSNVTPQPRIVIPLVGHTWVRLTRIQLRSAYCRALRPSRTLKAWKFLSPSEKIIFKTIFYHRKYPNIASGAKRLPRPVV